MGRAGLTAVLVVVGFGLFGAILALVGPAEVWSQVQALGPLGFLAMLGNDLLATLLWIASWGILLAAFGARLTWSALGGASLAGFAVSYVTPVAYIGGEPLRAWLASRKSGLPLPTVYATLLVDRLLAGLCLVGFAVLGGAFTLAGPLLPPTAKVQVAVALALVAAAVGLGVYSFVRNLHWLSRIVGLFARLRASWRRPAAWAAKVREVENDVHAAFHRFLPRTAVAFVLQALSFLCIYARPLIFFRFTEARAFSLSDLAVYFNLNAVLTTVLWLTPAGVGMAEGGRVGIFALLDISSQGAFAFSLTVRFLELLLVGAGLTYLSREGLLRIGKNRPEIAPLRGRTRRLARAVRGALEVGLLLVWAPWRPRWRQRAFARRFRRADPWDYETSAYERTKYDRKLAVLPRRPDPSAPPYARALEIGCAEGLFTRRMAREGVAQELVGVDFVPAALERARAQAADPRVRFARMDVTAELPDGTFDLVVLSEVLYYLGSLAKIRDLARRLAPKIAARGHVLLVGPWPAARLFHRPFLAHAELRVVSEHVEREPSRPYVITCLERADR